MIQKETPSLSVKNSDRRCHRYKGGQCPPFAGCLYRVLPGNAQPAYNFHYALKSIRWKWTVSAAFFFKQH